MTERHTALQSVREALDDITKAGDEARLQLHLLALEARHRKDDLAASIDGLERTLDRSVEQAVHAAARKTKQLTSTLQEFLARQGQPGDPGFVRVERIMTDDLRTCREGDTLSTPARLMWDHDCGSVVVLDDRDLLAGIITDRDLCMASYLQGLPLTAIRVGAVMTRNVQTCRTEQSVTQVAALMGQHQVHRMPVVNAHGHPMGIVSIADIVRQAHLLGAALAQDIIFQMLRSICQPRHRADGTPSQKAAE